jgi:hypothetical protein
MQIGDYSDDQVKQWMTGKTPEQVAAQAASMNLTPDQIQGAYALTGQKVSTSDITNYGTSRGYKFDPQTGGAQFRSPQAAQAFTDSNVAAGNSGTGFASNINGFVANRPVYLGNATDAKDPKQQLSQQQIKSWFDQNPNATPEQMAELAARYHMTPENVAQALSIGRGVAYNPQAVRDWLGNQQAYRIEGDGMISAPNRRSNGTNGASGVNTPFGQYGPDGLGYMDDGTPNTGAVQGPGILGSGSGATPSTGAGLPGNSGGSSSSSSGTSAPGNWQVTPDQTVESRVAGILAGGNPLVEQRRAQSDMKMNGRGLVNSSIAQTASDDAAYSAALDIARPDAATFADAAKTNAMAKTTWGISQANNQTSRDNTQSQIGAQRELQRATQLYNNLTSQTSTATNLQQWGLNTVASIQASDLSAEAKTSAIQTIQQYLQDSFQIQGDWHTTAARMIDSIFD